MTTQDDIIEMARQAAEGKPFFGFFPQLDVGLLESFAKLVAAKEREACAKVCENLPAALEEFDALGRAADAIRARGEA